jgi:enoyl-CoA hydratase/carnithine racemase
VNDIETADEVIVEQDGAVVTITLNRPAALNAITPTMLGRLGDELDTVAVDDGVRVVVLTGTGRAFSAGVDLKALGDRELVDGKVGDTHAKFGLRPTWGMSQRLPRLVGMAAARELSYTARNFTGAEAKQLGMIARSTPLESLDDEVSELVAALVANSAGSLAAYKDLYRVADEHSLADGLAYEAATHYPISDTGERLADFR